jgi:hypothetical protein
MIAQSRVAIEAIRSVSSHAADARRLLAALSVVNRRQSQQPPHLTGVLYRGRQAA